MGRGKSKSKSTRAKKKSRTAKAIAAEDLDPAAVLPSKATLYPADPEWETLGDPIDIDEHVADIARGPGRPRIPINEKQVIKLARLHCTHDEIAAFFNVSVDTIARNYADLIKEARDTGKVSLRRWLWMSARGGNLGAQIWLSKQHLGMSEKVEQKNENVNKAEITYVAEWGGSGEPVSTASGGGGDDGTE